MKKIFKIIEAGAKIAPASIIIIYCISRILDNYTTYLATPDLTYEGNWFIRRFNLTWGQIILKDSIIVIIQILGLFFSLGIKTTFITSQEKQETISLMKLISKSGVAISLIFVFCFFTHLFYSLFLIFSNYLQYVYLFRIDSLVSKLADWYVSEVINNISNLFIYYQASFVLLGILYTGFYLFNWYTSILKKSVSKK